MCSWESSQPPKLADGVRLLALVLDCRRGSTEKGAGLVNRLMLVRIQSSALDGKDVPRRSRIAQDRPKVLVLDRIQVGDAGTRTCPDGVADSIGPSEGPGPGSSPGRDTHRLITPCECDGRHGRLRICRTLVRFLGGVLNESQCRRSVPDSHASPRSSKTRFDSWRRHLVSIPRWNGGVPWQDATITTRPFFETMSKRRRGFPSETRVKRGVRIVNGDKLLEEKLRRHDLCPCGKRTAIQEVLPEVGPLLMA